MTDMESSISHDFYIMATTKIHLPDFLTSVNAGSDLRERGRSHSSDKAVSVHIVQASGGGEYRRGILNIPLVNAYLLSQGKAWNLCHTGRVRAIERKKIIGGRI